MHLNCAEETDLISYSWSLGRFWQSTEMLPKQRKNTQERSRKGREREKERWEERREINEIPNKTFYFRTTQREANYNIGIVIAPSRLCTNLCFQNFFIFTQISFKEG
jgi:hypothetical protein